MQLPKIYAGKILSVDLTTGKTQTLATADYAKRFVGGRGIAAKIYWDQVPPGAGAFDPENRLILSLGPMAGLPAFGASRWGMYAKSPYPVKEHFCYGSLGGHFGAGLKSAGYDGLVVSGKADRPSVLHIDEKGAVIKPAGDLWGTTTTDAMETLSQEGGGGRRVLAIGPAGENRVPFATVFADGDASCGGGMGAVMGSKNLKAITVLPGSFKPIPANPEALHSIEKEIRSYNRGNVKVWGMDFMEHGEKTKKLPCSGCMARCLRVSYTADNGKKGKYMCQSRFFYLRHAWDFYGKETDVPFLVNRLCDEYGIDTWEVQVLLEWALRSHAEGLITGTDGGLTFSNIGSLEFMESFLQCIIRRRGVGEILALGAERASGTFGEKSRKLLRHEDPYDPRYCSVNIMLLPFEKREPIQQLHEAGLLLAQWSSKAKGVPEAHVSTEALKGIAAKFWGSEAAADFTTLTGKADAARRIQDRQFAKECLCLCDWMYPLIDNPSSKDHVGDPTIESRLFSAASGLDYEEAALYRVGERVFNLQRAIMLREGHRPVLDDILPEEYHTQALETHVADPECIVPGADGNTTSKIGSIIDMREYALLREEYYALRGWDPRTGLQSAERLAELGLAEIGQELSKAGLAVPKAGRLSFFRRCYIRKGLKRDGAIFNSPRTKTADIGGPSIDGEALKAILEDERKKFEHPAILQNFAGWNKTMQYFFPDLGEYWVIRFENGKTLAVEKPDKAWENPEIQYEMNSWILHAMNKGDISGFKAYQQRKLKLRASFSDMMKLQSLNKA